ncbi:unnamed protein product [Closterium sp. NIES-64]|nr:unnamed protein product [Closterium sp. NIES-64]
MASHGIPSSSSPAPALAASSPSSPFLQTPSLLLTSPAMAGHDLPSASASPAPALAASSPSSAFLLSPSQLLTSPAMASHGLPSAMAPPALAGHNSYLGIRPRKEKPRKPDPAPMQGASKSDDESQDEESVDEDLSDSDPEPLSLLAAVRRAGITKVTRIEYALHMALDLTEPEEQHVVAVVLAADMHRASYELASSAHRFDSALTLFHIPSSFLPHPPPLPTSNPDSNPSIYIPQAHPSRLTRSYSTLPNVLSLPSLCPTSLLPSSHMPLSSPPPPQALTALTFRANANSTSFPPRKSLFLFARTLSHVPSSSSSHIPLSSTPPTQTLMVQPNPLRACFFPPSEELPLSPNCVVSPMILSHTPPASPLKPFHLHPPFPSFLLTRKELPPSAHSIVSTIILSQIPSSFHIPLSSSSPP